MEAGSRPSSTLHAQAHANRHVTSSDSAQTETPKPETDRNARFPQPLDEACEERRAAFIRND